MDRGTSARGAENARHGDNAQQRSHTADTKTSWTSRKADRSPPHATRKPSPPQTPISCRECQELRACDLHASAPRPLPNNLAWDLTSSIISRCDRSRTSSIQRARASYGFTRTSRGHFCDLQLTRAQCLSSCTLASVNSMSVSSVLGHQVTSHVLE